MSTTAPHPLDLPPPIDDLVATDRAAVERALLHEVIRDPDAGRALAACQPEDFTVGSHRAVWEVLRRLDADRAPIDLITVTEALEADGTLVKVGGWRGVTELLLTWDYLAPAIHLAEKLADAARRDRLIAAGRQVADMATAGDVDVAQVEDLLRPNLPEHDRGIESAWDVIEEILDRHQHPDREAGQRIGWRDVDPLYRVAPGLLSVVTGIPGSGKSSWVDAATVQLATRDDWRIAVFSPESAPTSRHALNLVSLHAGTNHGRLSIPQLHEHIDWVHNHYTWIRSTEAVTLAEVLRRADIIRRRGRLDGLVIDPWNELDHARPDHVTETQHISESLTRLRRWGRRHNIHLWLIAHPKKLDKRSDGTYPVPRLYDISGSSTWHDKADMGVVVHRDKTKPGPVDIQVVKVRFREHGGIGVAKLEFDIPTGRYHNHNLQEMA